MPTCSLNLCRLMMGLPSIRMFVMVCTRPGKQTPIRTHRRQPLKHFPASASPKQPAALKRWEDGSGGGSCRLPLPLVSQLPGPLRPAATAARLRTNSPGHGLVSVRARAISRRPFSQSPPAMEPLFAALMDWARQRWPSQLGGVSWHSAGGKWASRFVFCL
jgi:hypothetical protein